MLARPVYWIRIHRYLIPSSFISYWDYMMFVVNVDVLLAILVHDCIPLGTCNGRYMILHNSIFTDELKTSFPGMVMFSTFWPFSYRYHTLLTSVRIKL
jgi:hypothetical protein